MGWLEDLFLNDNKDGLGGSSYRYGTQTSNPYSFNKKDSNTPWIIGMIISIFTGIAVLILWDWILRL